MKHWKTFLSGGVYVLGGGLASAIEPTTHAIGLALQNAAVLFLGYHAADKSKTGSALDEYRK